MYEFQRIIPSSMFKKSSPYGIFCKEALNNTKNT